MLNMIENRANCLLAQNKGNIVSDMDGEKVMLNIHNGKYYNLGNVGGDIWERLNKPISLDQLISELMSQYHVEQAECEEQVTNFINKLIEEELIQLISK